MTRRGFGGKLWGMILASLLVAASGAWAQTGCVAYSEELIDSLRRLA